MNLQIAITEEDIDRIRDTAINPIRYADLLANDYFSRPEGMMKLVDVLGAIDQTDKVGQISIAISSAPLLHDLAAIHYLLSAEVRTPGAKFGPMGDNVQVCLDVYRRSLAPSSDRVGRLPFLCKVQLVKHLALAGAVGLISEFTKTLSYQDRRAILVYLASLGRFCATYLDRMKANVSFNKWIGFCQSLESGFRGTSSATLGEVAVSRALMLANSGNLDTAIESMKLVDGSGRALRRMLQLRKSVKVGDFGRAIETAEEVITANPVRLNTGRFDRSIAEAALCRINAVLHRAGIDSFIISGTLLGCIREGRIFEHDKDFDLGVIGWQTQFDVAGALLKSGEFAFTARDLRGEKLFLLPVRHIQSGYDFDIFFFHDRGDHFLHGIDSRLGYTINYRFSKFGLTERSFLGARFLVPDNAERMLEENYGSGWRVPDPNYFVKLESPALVQRSGPVHAFVARHEMIDLIQRGASRKKGHALIACINRELPESDRPSRKVLETFLSLLQP
jgi:hypothetical protein